MKNALCVNECDADSQCSCSGFYLLSPTPLFWSWMSLLSIVRSRTVRLAKAASLTLFSLVPVLFLSRQQLPLSADIISQDPISRHTSGQGEYKVEYDMAHKREWFMAV